MTRPFREGNDNKSTTYGNLCRSPCQGGEGAGRRWPALVQSLRERLGLSQAALADHLGVTQASVSRWENGLDQPSVRMRRIMRDMLRASEASRVERQLRARLRYAPSPMSIVGPGARFIDFSESFAAETSTEPCKLRGRPIYGQFGEGVDATTQLWEACGIFGGDIALTLTVLSLEAGGEQPIYLKNFDTPHILDSGQVISVCETRRVPRTMYDLHLARYGRPVFCLSYDEIAE